MSNITKIEGHIRGLTWRIKGWMFKFYLRAHGCDVGRRLRCQQFPVMRALPQGNIVIRDNVTFGYRVTLEPVGPGVMYFDNGVHLTQDIVVSCRTGIYFGEEVGIGEFVSIRDGDHRMEKHSNPHSQGFEVGEIFIGKGAGIGRGCSIYRGVRIEEGVVIGANSIVMRNFRSVPFGIYFGNPIRCIGIRK